MSELDGCLVRCGFCSHPLDPDEPFDVHLAVCPFVTMPFAFSRDSAAFVEMLGKAAPR